MVFSTQKNKKQEGEKKPVNKKRKIYQNKRLTVQNFESGSKQFNFGLNSNQPIHGSRPKYRKLPTTKITKVQTLSSPKAQNFDWYVSNSTVKNTAIIERESLVTIANWVIVIL